MRNTVIWSFLSLMALATGGLVAGCDSDAKLAKSSAGESCDNTSDCNDGLKCLQGTCYKTTSGTDNNEGGEGNTAGAPGVIGPTPPVLGSVGESCARRADCEAELACINQRCSEDGGGAGGAGSVGPELGGPGETCGLTSDCTEGLTCRPTDGYGNFIEAKAIGSNSVGVCTPTDNGLVATGMSCHGAECTTPDDCCELPIELHIANISAPTYGTGVNSCAELESVLVGVNCAAASLTTQNAARCFAQETYCACAKNTWSCSDAGRCVYEAACTDNYGTPGGCPTYSRAGYALTSICDLEGTGTCQPAAVEATCQADADCEGELVADGGGIERCTKDECTCYKPSGLCYRQCGEDLDCAVGKICDPDTSVCVSGVACESDAYCVVAYNDVNSKCIEGVCDTLCDTDLDCNYGQLTYGTSTRVCNDERRCEAVGCTTSQECPGTVGGVKLFCTATPAVAGGFTVSSATTD